ncbi:MAG: TIGR02186 family protein [Rhizobiales bacterium]|nr:TIGR02186 family protein [Hyphomicrobiales bacterium]
MTRRLAAMMILAAGIGTATAARAERLITSLSNHQIMITSNFTGTEVVLFGSVERDAATVARRGGYDIVVTVAGPRETVVTRRKARILGIWANVDSRIFVEAPSYLAVLSNKPITEIAAPDLLRRLQVGLTNTLLPQQVGTDVADVVQKDAFREAFLRIKRDHRLYREEANAVTFLTPTLFRASIPVPAVAPLGSYEIDVKLFADGTNIGRATSAMEIVKVGFEQFVANAAHDYGLLYGLATAFAAIVIGWFASVVFRRD